MKVIFTCGGTGGHIFPAIAIANEMKKMVNNLEILFVGATGKIEEKIVPENNYKLRTLPIVGFNKKNILSMKGMPARILKSLSLSKKIIKDFSPDVVVGTGGFASAPILYTAAKMKIPSLIQEGNSYPGKVTRYFSGKVNKVVINFSDTEKYFKRKDNIIKISHPVRLNLKRIDRTEANLFFDLNPQNKTIFVFGGSQGAKAINDCIKKIFGDLLEKNLNIIWQTGKNEFEEIIKLTGNYSNISVQSFISNMDYAYSAADLVICRAGISSIMEISYLQVPAILIPYPFAAENHQEKNSRSLEQENSCMVILQNELEAKLADNIISLINDSKKLEMFKENVGKFSDKEAAKKIVTEILKLKA